MNFDVVKMTVFQSVLFFTCLYWVSIYGVTHRKVHRIDPRAAERKLAKSREAPGAF